MLAGNTTLLLSAGRWSSFPVSLEHLDPLLSNVLTVISVIYFFFPETARLTLEEIAQNFGEEVAVHLTDATDEEKAKLDEKLAHSGGGLFESSEAPIAPVSDDESKEPKAV